jgi:guanylate kinase
MQECKNAIIISAPSGAGKTTLVNHLLKKIPDLSFSVSACSRPRRENEMHGKDYYFLSPDAFRNSIDAGDFIEWEEVYAGILYGTLKSEVQRIREAGKIPVFDVDVAGGLNLKKYFGHDALAVFIQPPSLEVLETRLRKRRTDSEESLRKRIGKAAYEMTYAARFDVVIDNDSLDEAVKELFDLVSTFITGSTSH